MPGAPTIRFLDRRTPPHLFTLVLLAGLGAMVMNIFLPSLPQMADYFGTSYAVMQLSVPLYLLFSAVIQLFVGPISDNLGRRKVMMWCLTMFLIFTLGCIFAPNAGVFLTFRLAQAVAATAMVLSRAVIRDLYSQDESASMIGYVTMGMALVPMVGPMIGGALEQSFDWHASFGFLALAGAFVFALCWADQGETVTGQGMGFSEQLATYPELLTSRRFWGYAACAAFASGAFFALLGGASFVAQGIFGLSPFMTGIALGSPAIGYAAGKCLSGRYSVRFGIDRMALAGTIVASLGMALSLGLSLAGTTSALVFFGCCTFLGLGNGLTMPNATAGLLSVRPRLAGTASGLGGAIMIAGGAALSGAAGTMLTERTGALPLQALMLLSSALAGLSMVLVMRRAKRLAG